ncbi:type 2 isopentenyl-diphosphate Delta-isomerase [Streptococcus sp. zg-86]|uniref:Isopentenyl-diphosphate delta-isomerase n=1 Tax=Streptococcus zhangguiae TaxID=2664091 RepID=A0A6I4RCA9_9STRE|nr:MULTISPECIES: type 2 isopentenyl-diphosphate Delta-isomerase [unclassified Streptococcus]MTB63612.1 type 2 isopentenyl-diphosphate Delta-isomerase [Streptococcus sp. zg-86]MTB89739.1 type 2 isopentenyl-diphosphate Delta-isomerase [Streptococcus sp. zg-36]MWV55410.1 type 2 isopentenyl-diphosphate Delta-isomerase [Streptococcus sp. zg-70]QTH47606.1 type 2 isopentenyl-diphosphate Delta-isomerase [Streptococcus sp. zg-86]
MFEKEVVSPNRKNQHVALANQQFTMESASDFEQTRFVHHSLPEMKVADVSLKTSVAGLDFEMPFFVNAMTGGSKKTGEINQLLGILGHETKIPLATGSISAALKDPSLAQTFSIMRKENPHGIIFANLGAHHDLDNARRAVELVEADALQLHVNAPQEMVMPEGDRDFSMWLKNIETIVGSIEVPVIVKEVGFGMSRETVSQLSSIGVRTVDISGVGGTDFAKIENARRIKSSYDYLHGWGQSTVVSVVEAMSLPEQIRPEVMASGGVKTPLDIVKLLALGSSAVGLSNRMLQLVKNRQSVEQAIEEVELFCEGIAAIMTLLGAKSVTDLHQTDLVLAPGVQNWCQARGIDWVSYANRSANHIG